MPIEILMPALSPTMKEGNLAKWIKKEGDKIKAGEVIAEIETDKATMEVEAVDEGILGKILVQHGTENVAVNSCIALILADGEDKKVLDSYQVSSNQNISNVGTKNDSSKSSSPIKNDKNNVVEKVVILEKTSDANIVKASPLAKRIAKDEGVTLSLINGSGPHGRVVKDDVIDFVKNGSSRSMAVRRNPQEFYVIKNNNIRKVIAKRLLESKQNVPHFYLSCEFKIDKLNELRSALNEVAEIDENGNPAYKISVNDLIIKATAMALKKVPEANSSWNEDGILVYNNIDISMAVAIDGGLITPIIKNADQKSIQAISREAKQLAKKAREGKLTPEEFQGGTFSISNLGMFGIDNFSAIINPPQSCILAVSRAVEKPIVEHGQIKIAHMMNVTLSSDHRVVDGAVGAEFLKALRRYIEHPILSIL
ncbi:MAG: pyruvate dehydrogenase complex dihydrolipoamide acetyltransferase [Proteobacteria bacterium]|nr:pyruvate dehydrogenase complex dihydrolipoamide acetyltransferase [Pseudomonadota bacterium]NCA28267.1 pyruvate dehydrogenase complex dihydrolipoamide acetyltransferase [Pseudomonadota bacterium]